MRKKIFFIVFISLISILSLSSCVAQKKQSVYAGTYESTEKTILYDLVKEVDTFNISDSSIQTLAKAKKILEDVNASSENISSITGELLKIKEEYLNKTIVFVDMSLEKRIKNILAKPESENITVYDALGITCLLYTSRCV